MLRPDSPNARREKILLMGSYGTGKTTAWLNIAKWSHQTQSPSRFYVLDSDDAVGAFLEPGSQYAHLDARAGGNVHFTPVFEWVEYETTLRNYAAKAGPDDWLIVDFISTAWDAVQEHYVDQIFKADIAEFFLEARKALKGATGALDGWKDWSVINRLYRGWVNTLVHRSAGHKFLTAMTEPMREGEDKANKATYSAVGVRPKGQKHLGHIPHTILYSQMVRAGEVFLTTVKDRERQVLEGAPIKEFTIDYLVKVAGWKL